MSRFLIFSAGVLAGAVAVSLFAPPSTIPPAEVRVLTLRDTVRVETPRPIVRRVTDTIVVSLPAVADTIEAVEVAMPVEQAVYAGENYRAYVSGYLPRLDSLQFISKEVIRTVAVPGSVQTKRFSVGIQAGYGYTPRGFQPYIGIGVSIGIVRF